jgi:galactose mutarotase-like enzyme
MPILTVFLFQQRRGISPHNNKTKFLRYFATLFLVEADRKKQMIEISSPELIVTVAPFGAAMSSLRQRDTNTELLGHWLSSHGNKTSGFTMWPLVGAISESGKFLHRGQIYTPGKHGFARATKFICARQLESSVLLRHTHDPAATPGIYPFPHQIDIEHTVSANEVAVSITVQNLSDETMYHGFGFHPAFAWPLPGNTSIDGHTVTLLQGPTGLANRRPNLASGLMYEDVTEKMPFDAQCQMLLDKPYFRNDAAFLTRLFDQHPTQPLSLRYRGPKGPVILVTITGCDGVGIWSKPDSTANFVCIEPLAGTVLANPNEPMPELKNIRGLRQLLAGQTFEASIKISISKMDCQ